MVKVAAMTIPPEFETLLAKILAHFDQMIYPTWASRMFHTTRSAKARNLEKTYIPGVRGVWSTFTSTQKAAWKAAAGYTGYSNYQLFTADYSYRKKHNLSLPKRDMTPQTIEEKIICYADKFFSKSTDNLLLPKPLKKVKKSVNKYGEDKWKVFEEMKEMFGTDLVYK